MTLDVFKRPLRDLRVSVTDRCNFRCVYCMPKEIFGKGYSFLPQDQANDLTIGRKVWVANTSDKSQIFESVVTGIAPPCTRRSRPCRSRAKTKRCFPTWPTR